MQKYLLIHYGEIALKGGNRQFFEKRLMENIQMALLEFGNVGLKHIQGRIIVKIEDKWDLDKVREKLLKVFGIEYFAMAWNSDLNLEKISQDLLVLLKEQKFKSFRITTRRANKEFALTSQQISEQLGELVMTKLKKKVNLHEPDINCRIDIFGKFAFIYFEKIICRGGLPVGVSGNLLCLISGGIDSPVAANLMQKRGANIVFVNFDAYPATPKENQEKVKDLAKVLAEYQNGSKLYLVPFLAIQQEVIKIVPEDYRVIFYRRMMLRIAKMIAQKENILALVTGDSLGQVASQTVENISAISQAIDLPIFRPLIGFNKEEIITIARQIETYELSAQPFADCCSLYVPQHPVTRADLNLIKDTEKNWNFQVLLAKTLEMAVIIKQ
ncbi:MAG: tRNA 4-thiouridine(8) synthase ThiI [Candidatus Parcubacteria bacterium]|nr:tRNA 4-thiouridine(8) synthase ThiI [Candidatus Parcubacteria bacterium]